MDKTFFTVSELSTESWFPYKQGSIRKFIKTGQLKVRKFSSRKTLIHRADAENFLINNLK